MPSQSHRREEEVQHGGESQFLPRLQEWLCNANPLFSEPPDNAIDRICAAWAQPNSEVPFSVHNPPKSALWFCLGLNPELPFTWFLFDASTTRTRTGTHGLVEGQEEGEEEAKGSCQADRGEGAHSKGVRSAADACSRTVLLHGLASPPRSACPAERNLRQFCR